MGWTPAFTIESLLFDAHLFLRLSSSSIFLSNSCLNLLANVISFSSMVFLAKLCFLITQVGLDFDKGVLLEPFWTNRFFRNWAELVTQEPTKLICTTEFIDVSFSLLHPSILSNFVSSLSISTQLRSRVSP